jgi:uncharacterized protein (DUF2062 family)
MARLDAVRHRLARFTAHFRDNLKKEQPNQIAAGCAVGIGVNFIPTLGLGFLLAFLVAVLTKVSRTSATATSLLTGPLVPLMYGLNLLVGGLISAPVGGHDNLVEFVASQYANILRLGDFRTKLLGILDVVGTTFLIGSAVNAVLFGCCTYLIVRQVLIRSHHRH